MTKKRSSEIFTLKMEIFPEIGPRKIFLVPPKFGARSPPMVHDHTCGSLRESVADVRHPESGEEEESHPPEDIEPRLRRNLHVLHPTGPNPTDKPRRLRHGLRPDCPKRPDRAARAEQS